MFNIAIFVSGSGSNMSAIIEAIENKTIVKSNISLVVADRQCMAIEKAINKGIDVLIVSRKSLKNQGWIKLLKIINNLQIDLIVLAGYLSVVHSYFINNFNGKIINIHPSLLPKYSGMFGMNIHKAVIDNKDKISGATVHYVNEIVDGGKIILQKSVDVDLKDNANSLATKVLCIEHQILVDSINKLLN